MQKKSGKKNKNKRQISKIQKTQSKMKGKKGKTKGKKRKMKAKRNKYNQFSKIMKKLAIATITLYKLGTNMKQKATNSKNQQQQTAAKWQAMCIFKDLQKMKAW
jgi:hypothetical protein